jgi:hypothetical protein
VRVAVPPSAAAVLADPTATVRFALATASLDPEAALPEVTLELVDAAGRVASTPLSAVGGVFPPMATNPWKSREVAALAMLGEGVSTDAETHLQTYALPVAAFNAVPGFDPTQVRAVRFAIAGPESGALFLDEVGIDPS